MVRFLKEISKCLLMLTAGLCGLTTNLHAQEKYDFIISLQSGFQHTGYSSKDTYINMIEEKHGKLSNTRVVNPLIVSVEIFQLMGNSGVGFGFENQRYTTDYIFEDDSRINIDTGGNFINILVKYKGDFFEPFLGAGTGTYTGTVNEFLEPIVSSNESTTAKMRISNRHSNQGKVGIRFSLITDCGIMIASYSIAASIVVPSEDERMELGGDSVVTGIYCQF